SRASPAPRRLPPLQPLADPAVPVRPRPARAGARCLLPARRPAAAGARAHAAGAVRHPAGLVRAPSAGARLHRCAGRGMATQPDGIDERLARGRCAGRRLMHTRAVSSLAARTSHSFPQEVIASMQYGTVKWINDAKGFGFISPEDGSADASENSSAIDTKGCRSLQEGQRVRYEVQQGAKGAQSDGVKPAE